MNLFANKSTKVRIGIFLGIGLGVVAVIVGLVFTGLYAGGLLSPSKSKDPKDEGQNEQALASTEQRQLAEAIDVVQGVKAFDGTTLSSVQQLAQVDDRQVAAFDHIAGKVQGGADEARAAIAAAKVYVAMQAGTAVDEATFRQALELPRCQPAILRQAIVKRADGVQLTAQEVEALVTGGTPDEHREKCPILIAHVQKPDVTLTPADLQDQGLQGQLLYAKQHAVTAEALGLTGSAKTNYELLLDHQESIKRAGILLGMADGTGDGTWRADVEALSDQHLVDNAAYVTLLGKLQAGRSDIQTKFPAILALNASLNLPGKLTIRDTDPHDPLITQLLDVDHSVIESLKAELGPTTPVGQNLDALITVAHMVREPTHCTEAMHAALDQLLCTGNMTKAEHDRLAGAYPVQYTPEQLAYLHAMQQRLDELEADLKDPTVSMAAIEYRILGLSTMAPPPAGITPPVRLVSLTFEASMAELSRYFAQRIFALHETDLSAIITNPPQNADNLPSPEEVTLLERFRNAGSTLPTWNFLKESVALLLHLILPKSSALTPDLVTGALLDLQRLQAVEKYMGFNVNYVCNVLEMLRAELVHFNANLLDHSSMEEAVAAASTPTTKEAVRAVWTGLHIIKAMTSGTFDDGTATTDDGAALEARLTTWRYLKHHLEYVAVHAPDNYYPMREGMIVGVGEFGRFNFPSVVPFYRKVMAEAGETPAEFIQSIGEYVDGQIEDLEKAIASSLESRIISGSYSSAPIVAPAPGAAADEFAKYLRRKSPKVFGKILQPLCTYQDFVALFSDKNADLVLEEESKLPSALSPGRAGLVRETAVLAKFMVSSLDLAATNNIRQVVPPLIDLLERGQCRLEGGNPQEPQEGDEPKASLQQFRAACNAVPDPSPAKVFCQDAFERIERYDQSLSALANVQLVRFENSHRINAQAWALLKAREHIDSQLAANKAAYDAAAHGQRDAASEAQALTGAVTPLEQQTVRQYWGLQRTRDDLRKSFDCQDLMTSKLMTVATNPAGHGQVQGFLDFYLQRAILLFNAHPMRILHGDILKAIAALMHWDLALKLHAEQAKDEASMDPATFRTHLRDLYVYAEGFKLTDTSVFDVALDDASADGVLRILADLAYIRHRLLADDLMSQITLNGDAPVVPASLDAAFARCPIWAYTTRNSISSLQIGPGEELGQKVIQNIDNFMEPIRSTAPLKVHLDYLINQAISDETKHKFLAIPPQP